MFPPCPNQTSHTHHHLGGPYSPQLQVLVLLVTFFSPIILTLILSNHSCQLISASALPRCHIYAQGSG